ncbi:Protein of uncharacterised function [Citrobacter koseri]|uniref:Protein of uncharacterized function n=1 Tax=Citrobacter koseri TaxID=545 RepID=A0A2X2W9G5_CITKO|nr:Protein of uncharacterised function [Citrobacter koseri]
MELYIQILVVACLTGMTSLLAHRSAAVFHDGIRPILPQLIEGYMNRREAGSIAFGLSIGFVASVGISFTLKTGLLNAWLLFLPTDILGVLAINSLLAFGLGAAWGVLILTCLLPVNHLLTALPVDVLGSLGELSFPGCRRFCAVPAGGDFLSIRLETQSYRCGCGADGACPGSALLPASEPGID